jgi:hypothetical protein
VKICVLVKQVPDAAVEKRMDPATGRLDRSGETNLNPFDTHAIEAAMQVREGGAVDVDEIVAVTMGPESAFRALHKAVSLGADRSIHLTDEALAGSDVCATGYALAKVLEERTEDFRQRLAACERDLAEDEDAAGLYISCVSNALEEYASDLEDPLIRLPPELQAISNVMRQTVAQLRTAASASSPQAAVAQARAAIGNLVDFVRQQTELVSAVDPETEALLVEHGNVIAGAVEEMDLALVGAVEI